MAKAEDALDMVEIKAKDVAEARAKVEVAANLAQQALLHVDQATTGNVLDVVHDVAVKEEEIHLQSLHQQKLVVALQAVLKTFSEAVLKILATLQETAVVV